MLEHAIFSEESARLPGVLQKVDGRAKVAVALVLLVVAGLLRRFELLVAISLITLLLAGLSRLSVTGFARRVWIGIPLFAGVIALPSSFLLPGEPLIVIAEEGDLRLAITDSGLASALLLIARVGASVSIALLLVSTTRWTDLLRALSIVRVPRTFLLVLAMTYRYLFLFLHSANNLFLARASRTVGVTSTGEQRQWASGAVGVLVSRSVKLSGDVLQAMLARGFTGEFRSASDRKMRDADWLLVALGLSLASAFLLIDRWIR